MNGELAIVNYQFSRNTFMNLSSSLYFFSLMFLSLESCCLFLVNFRSCFLNHSCFFMQQAHQFCHVISRYHFNTSFCRRQFVVYYFRECILPHAGFSTFNGLVRAAIMPRILGIRCSATPFDSLPQQAASLHPLLHRLQSRGLQQRYCRLTQICRE